MLAELKFHNPEPDKFIFEKKGNVYIWRIKIEWLTSHGLSLEEAEKIAPFIVYEVEPGIYSSNYSWELEFCENYRKFPHSYQYGLSENGYKLDYRSKDLHKYFHSSKITFGLADSLDQIKQFYSEQMNGDDAILNIQIVNRCPGQSGIRWHKWGEYIGDYKDKATGEYYDEEFPLDSLYSFEWIFVEKKYE